MQRADIGRFFILFKYGGLYADLDVFPNRDTFPQVSLGVCKMLARNTKTNRLKPEWEIEVVVATAHNEVILDILEDMKDKAAGELGEARRAESAAKHSFEMTDWADTHPTHD